MHGGVGVGVISDADVRVEPYAVRWGFGEGVVGVDEAAFGGFKVVGCEGVGDAAEAEGGGGVEGGGVEGDFYCKERGGAVELGMDFFFLGGGFAGGGLGSGIWVFLSFALLVNF